LAIAFLMVATAMATTPALARTAQATDEAAQVAERQALGAALFHGHPSLTARLRHQDMHLPPVASRCSNCHASTADANALAPTLDADGLLTARPRHGGPPSRYERDSFCRLLRTGIAPAEVIVGQAMPIFELTDAQCDALWRHLTRR